MNLMEDCETSLQVLRGFETDITTEVNDIKAKHLYFSLK
jgi:SP family facilitated glucose transporter-like MFS transporter 8